MKSLKLDGRLKIAMDFVGRPSVFADIGCDHGYAACAIALQDSSIKVIASDISNNSLEKARISARLYGVEDNISFRVGDGLFPFEQNEMDTALICGMGGFRIIKILEKCMTNACLLSRIILGAQSDIPQLRAFLMRNGFSIEREALAYQNNIFYEIIQTKYTGKFHVPTLIECEVGNFLFNNSMRQLSANYLGYRIMQIENAFIKSAGNMTYGERIYKNKLKQKLEEYLLWLSK